MEDTQLQLQMKSMAISNGDTRSSVSSYTPSVKLYKDLYPPEKLDIMNWIKSNREEYFLFIINMYLCMYIFIEILEILQSSYSYN